MEIIDVCTRKVRTIVESYWINVIPCENHNKSKNKLNKFLGGPEKYPCIIAQEHCGLTPKLLFTEALFEKEPVDWLKKPGPETLMTMQQIFLAS